MKFKIEYKPTSIITVFIILIFFVYVSSSFGKSDKKNYIKKNYLAVNTNFVGDGVTDNTKAIQAALDSVSSAGGGVIRFTNGKFITGPLTIMSNDTLEIDSTAGILGTKSMTAYYKPGADTTKPPSSLQPLLTANHADNIAIIGKGYIDGQGEEWWTAYKNGTITTRPRLFQPNYCNNVLLKNITLKNSPQFHFIPEWCNNVIVDSVTILAPSSSPNTDGIDPATCHNVHITDCYIDTGDDNVAVKSGKHDPSDPNAASTKIYVSHCTFLHGHGVSIGSETGGGVDSMYVDSCTFNGTTNGIRIKSYRGNGGNVRGIYYTNLTMTNVEYPILFTEYYPKIPSQSDPAQPVTSLTPHYHDITVRNFTSTGSPYGGVIVGLPEMPLTNIHLENVNISSIVGIQVRNATVDTNNVKIKVSRGLPYTLEVDGYVTGPTFVKDISLPSGYSLSQNFPNPFNPDTRIRYTVPAVTHVHTNSQYTTLKVFDILGNELVTLVNKKQSPGNYEVEFNASNLPSGVYFYQLKIGNFISTKKMTLLK